MRSLRDQSVCVKGWRVGVVGVVWMCMGLSGVYHLLPYPYSALNKSLDEIGEDLTSPPPALNLSATPISATQLPDLERERSSLLRQLETAHTRRRQFPTDAVRRLL